MAKDPTCPNLEIHLIPLVKNKLKGNKLKEKKFKPIPKAAAI
jgi:hypothetical protein